MDWLIIDQEEDLFELDNVRDEDKMMRALWNRWIFLNRCVMKPQFSFFSNAKLNFHFTYS